MRSVTNDRNAKTFNACYVRFPVLEHTVLLLIRNPEHGDLRQQAHSFSPNFTKANKMFIYLNFQRLNGISTVQSIILEYKIKPK